MTALDLSYVALIVIGILLDRFALWPRFLRRSPADPGSARLWIWSAWMGVLWTLVAIGVALWLSEARSWESLRLVAPHGWRLWCAVGLVLVVAMANGQMVLRISRRKRARRVKLGNPIAELCSPQTSTELRRWVALSLTAGLCEEFVFRGYLIWAFQPLLGLWGAAALSLVIFTIAHAYQGATGVLGAGIVGGLLTLVVLGSGSILPAMALHAIIDVGQGLVAWLVLRSPPGEGNVDATQHEATRQ